MCIGVVRVTQESFVIGELIGVRLYVCMYSISHNVTVFKLGDFVSGHIEYRKLCLLSAHYLLSTCPLLVINYCLLSACA